jgi:hypothetical protein
MKEVEQVKYLERIKMDVLHTFKKMNSDMGNAFYKDSCKAYMEAVLTKIGYRTNLNEYLDITRLGFTLPVVINFDLVIENTLMVKFIYSELEEKNLQACMGNLLKLSKLKCVCLVKIENVNKKHHMSFIDEVTIKSN